MKEVILLLAEVVNLFHEVIWKISNELGLNLTDKELHFWVIGILGVFGLLLVDLLFHSLSKWSITAISFLFTFAMVLVFVFAVEIQQRITGAGNMEFADAAYSVLGFLAFCVIYLMIKGFYKWIR
ncbi:hypothetical protein [Halobacillus andaensis]|uniref:hypothetical protein n=1 Tax=Halobacillus andaensis TaxID=1176239 RepID=UPI001668502B|nr:hypothetical protein [Halobacillus andaensis]MBP2005349.1 uncharacterized membrane protein YuzA (DUF378 family) [Halobacillus andaensis]